MREIEVPSWLEGLPMAPEFRPTDTEFADPISYISKIEKQASAFGICKVIPPLPKPSKKYVYYNLNKSLLERPELGSEGEKADGCSLGKYDNDVRRAVFTTRQQELGVKRSKEAIQWQQPGSHKQVWQSGEIYTIEQFESKSKAFSKSMLGTVKDSSPLVVESMFWEAASDKPIYIEYANDVPGSGFSEPDGSFRYFHRRRRKRVSRKNRQVRSVCKKYVEEDTVRDSLCKSNKDVGGTINSSCQVPKASTSLSVLALDDNEANSQGKSSDAYNELEGTSGWKLSNSPWNLKVIARSPGSLTRFMPDDIPGVTSPMVYIGMLFSWFAWHVEDHELHSLNFLHTGSPKTWYAVPGDYAFAFEEVIRTHAYGGSIDRLAALSLLGEKTTLLSPEVVVGSKIPCCRLIQNPGEFVVTFPRAYHVGFSHGFNCGEAANFGTSQWLKVAKEAAVRRAAMNYLPMLSHQQLLYLLTMSFVSRIPRSLLPGARSSRLRDRQKEERELSVKKAFVADIVNENKLLAILIGKHPSYCAVLWDPESLPSIRRESQLPAEMANVTSTSGQNISHCCSETNPTRSTLLDDLSLYMENMNHLYKDDDDFLCDFQVDSGTVACVACGILGFPFMSVIQPSETAYLEILRSNNILVKKDIGISKCVNSPLDQEGTVNKSIAEDCPVGSLNPANMPRPSISKFGKEWNTSSRILRPRIFCLEHAIQIEELLQSRGGANVLVICHSDYQKIKSHAVAVADEIGSPPFSTEVLLDDATEQDLNLIDFAVDEEEQHGSVEDWSSMLGINLHYCVKIRKNSPSMQVQHALKLGGITSDSAGSSALNFKWQSRKTRSKVNQNFADHLNEETKNEKDEELARTSDQSMVQKSEQIIQYTRRNSKPKSVGSLGESSGHVHCKQVSVTTSSNSSKLRVNTYATNRSDIRTSEGNIYETNSSNSRDSGSDSEASGTCGSQEDVLFEIKVSEESNVMTRLSSIGDGTSERQSKVSITERPTEENLMSFTGSFVATHVIRVPTVEMSEEIDLVEVDVELEACQPVRMGNSVGMCLTQSDERDVPMVVTSKFQASHTFHDLDLVEERVDARLMNLPVGRSCTMVEMVKGTFVEHFTSTAVKSVCRNDEICNSVPGDSEVGNENTSTDLRNEDLFSDDVLLVNNLSRSSIEASSEVASEIRYKELAQELTTVVVCPIDKEDSNTQMEKGAAGNLSDGATSNEEQKLSAFAKDMRKPISGDLMLMICPAHSSKISGDSYTEVNLDGGLQRIGAVNGNSEEEIISSNLVQIDKGTACSLEERSDISKETVPKYLCIGNTVCSREVSMESPSRSSFEDVPGVPNEIVMETNSDGGLHAILSMDNSEVAGPSLNNVVNCNKRTAPPVEDNIAIPKECDGSKACSSQEKPPLEDLKSTPDGSALATEPKVKRKRELDQLTDEIYNFNYTRSPCEGLRSRVGKDSSKRENAASQIVDSNPPVKRMRQQKSDGPIPTRGKSKQGSYMCDLEGCRMRFKTKGELQMHQRNQCPVQGCRKKFSCHRYAVVHHRVHKDERPLNCSWKGCTMTFKWAWARTEHLRVHTGERPYKCKVEGCGLSFRFISDFSRHRRKVGHYVNPPT